jgi:hypothetical protein
MTDSDPVQHNAGMGHVGVVLVLALIAAVGYWISLHRHPWGRSCRKCKGTGRQQGLIFRYAWRPCTRCGGNSDRARLGIRFGHPRSQVWGERAPQPARDKRDRNYGR